MNLPAPIAAYFQADLGDGASVAACFTEGATVIDEGRTHVGRAAIRDWKTAASRTFNYTVEPFLIAESGGRTIVTAHLAGDFPGSPLDLRYFFSISGDKIASLEIRP